MLLVFVDAFKFSAGDRVLFSCPGFDQTSLADARIANDENFDPLSMAWA